MVRALGNPARKLARVATILGFLSLTVYGQEDPPSRVARLNHIEGNVSMEPAGLDDWAPAQINHPFSIGDYLYTDQGARAELHMDVAVMRMGPQTSFGFLNVSDQGVQIKLAEGDMSFRMHNLSPNEVFEVDTPNAAITLLSNGIYRFRVDPNGNMSFTVVRQGEAQVTGGGQAFTLNAGNSAMLSGTDQLSYDVEVAPVPDDFDNWCGQRDAHEAHLASARYLPPTVIGYEDLDDYGGWQQVGSYGAVWYPRQVASDWAPYRSGHWAWVDPWGWTWVDQAPWGFAPFHYGRWAYISGRWGWCPGPMAIGYQGPPVRPYYAPALVAWFGGSHWGVSVSIGGGGPSLGWVALGFGEVYTPTYHCSPRYFQSVNVSNTTIVKTVNITNVYNTVYVNHTVYNNVTYVNARAPGAVMAMSQSALSTGRPVAQAAIVVRNVNVTQIQAAAVVAPAVAPQRQALVASLGSPAAHPAIQVTQQRVVVKNTPPAPPAPFAARQQYLQQHAGQIHDYQAMHQAVAPRAATVAYVRPAPAARTVTVQPGAKVGNPPPVARGQIPAMGSTPARPNAQPQAQPAARVQQTPQPAARPGTTPQPAARVQQAPATPAARTPAPAARTTAAPTPAARTESRPAPAARTTAAPTPAARSTAAPTPAARTESRPAPATRTTAAPTPAARTESRPAPATRTTAAPAPAARTESRPVPATRTTAAPTPAARTEERPAPAARSTAAPAPAARSESRPAPATRTTTASTPATRTESRPAPAARSTAPEAKGESRPAPAAKERRTTEKDTKEHP